jgi:beta-glucosidase
VIAVEAGNDFVMTTPEFFDAAQQAVRDGALDERLIDDAVRRILTLKFELGLFESARLPAETRQSVIGTAAHAEINLEVARRSLVLLRNDGTLPFQQPAGREPTVAVIGPNADDQHAQLGDWAGASGQVPWLPDGHPRELTTTVLDGLRRFTPVGWTVTYARGADIGSEIVDPAGEVLRDGQPRPKLFIPAAPDPDMIEEAVRTANAADWAVVVLGDTVALTGESKSTATLELQGAQTALLDALVATETPVVLVLIQSKPSVLPPSAERVAAIIEAFNPGMQGGRAIAELLTGAIEPSGRLPISFPRHAGQLPVYYNAIRGQHGDRYADLTQDPLFAFGEGLSYTHVDYSSLRLAADRIPLDGTIRGSVTLANRGDRPALETVQIYIRDRVTSVTWADKELKSFLQVSIPPGETIDVEFELAAGECSLVDRSGRRVVEVGEFDLLVGTSSRDRDLLTAAFEITNPSM